MYTLPAPRTNIKLLKGRIIVVNNTKNTSLIKVILNKVASTLKADSLESSVFFTTNYKPQQMISPIFPTHFLRARRICVKTC